MRLLVADGHGLIRAGIQQALENEDGIEFVGEVEAGEQLLIRIERLQVDLVLLDMQLPGIDVQTALERIGDTIQGCKSSCSPPIPRRRRCSGCAPAAPAA